MTTDFCELSPNKNGIEVCEYILFIYLILPIFTGILINYNIKIKA